MPAERSEQNRNSSKVSGSTKATGDGEVHTRPRSFRAKDWVAVTFSVIAVLISFFSFLDGRINSYRLLRVEADGFLSKAWDALGGKRNSVYVESDSEVAIPRLEKARRLIERAKILDPDYAKVHRIEGVYLYLKGKPDRAIDAFRIAIELDEYDPDSYANLGLALKSKGDLDQAMAEYRKALELDPESILAHYNLGLAYSDQRDFEQAKQCIEEALKLEPKNEVILTSYGNILADLGLLEEAETQHRRATQLNTSYGAAYSNLASVLESQGRYEEAAYTFEVATQLDPYAGDYYDLGRLLTRLKKYEKAREAFEKALELDSSHKDAREALESLPSGRSNPAAMN